MIVLGVGLKNEIVTVRPNFGRFKLLASGLAVYASPENLEKLKKDLENSDNKVQTTLHSSRFAELVYSPHCGVTLIATIYYFTTCRLDATWQVRF